MEWAARAYAIGKNETERKTLKSHIKHCIQKDSENNKHLNKH